MISGASENSGCLAAIGPERTLLNVFGHVPVGTIRGTKIQVAAHPARVASRSVQPRAGKKETIVIVVSVHQPRERELAMVVQARDALGFLFGLAQRRQEQAGQDGNDRDDHQQLNESEGGSGLAERAGSIDLRLCHFSAPEDGRTPRSAASRR